MEVFVLSDGARLGPFTKAELIDAVHRGRIKLADLAWQLGNSEWMPLHKIPGVLDALIPPLPSAPVPVGSQAPSPATQAQEVFDKPTTLRKHLAVTSAILGGFGLIPAWLAMLHIGITRAPLISHTVSGVLGMFLLLGIPAIICGYIACRRTRRMPEQYGGTGLTKAGLAMGYLSIFTLLLLLPSAVKGFKERSRTVLAVNCANNMKQIGLAFKLWSLANQDRYPFNVPVNEGGSKELCSPDADGFDLQPFAHLILMSNELSTTKILVCPGDSSKKETIDWQSLRSSNVTYRVHVGPGVDERYPQAVLGACPIHGHFLLCDGSIRLGPRFRNLEMTPNLKRITEPIVGSDRVPK